MDSGYRGIALLAVLGTSLLALIASFVLGANDGTSTLYCVTPSSEFSISTLNTSLPKAQCFRVENGLFTEVIEGPVSDTQKVVSLDGFVLPGLIDGHGHILQYGEMLESVLLYGADSVEEVRTRIKEFLKKHPNEGYGQRNKWIRGIGWDQAYFGGVMPTAEELGADPLLANLFISLDRVDVHCVWTSQKVLDLLPNPLPEAPPGGVVVTNPGPGVFCDNAMDAIIAPIAPKPDAADNLRWLKSAMTELNKVGIVGVGNAGMRPSEVSTFESFAEKGGLTMRISVMLECPERNTYCLEEAKSLKLTHPPNAIGPDTLGLGGVKLFADGALGSWGAALLEPYSDKPETSGTMLINETDLTTVVSQWFNAGFQVNVHAIGDRANRAAVDAFEKVLGSDCEGCNDAKRLRIEHAQIIHPDDQKRIAKMGIIPSIQPTHATSDMAYAVERLGEDRLAHSAYRMATLFPTDKASKYPGPVLGSDFPVEPPNPFHGMYAAVTRLSPLTGDSPAGPDGWYPVESLTVEQALQGFTKNAAYGWFQESKAGSIEVGKWADWIVINKDILADASGKSLRDVKVLETWVGGKKVHPAVVEATPFSIDDILIDIGETMLTFLPATITGQAPAGSKDNTIPKPWLARQLEKAGDRFMALLPDTLTNIAPETKEAIVESIHSRPTFSRFVMGMYRKLLYALPGSITGIERDWVDPDAEVERPGPSSGKYTLERLTWKLGNFIMQLLPADLVGNDW